MWDQITHPANDWFWAWLWAVATPILMLIVGYLAGLRDGHRRGHGHRGHSKNAPDVISDTAIREALDKHKSKD